MWAGCPASSAGSVASAYPQDQSTQPACNLPPPCAPAAGVSRTAEAQPTAGKVRGPGAGTTVAGVDGKPLLPDPTPVMTTRGCRFQWGNRGTAGTGNLRLPGLGSEHRRPGTCHLLTSPTDSAGGGSQACPDTTGYTLLVAIPGAAKWAPRVARFSVPSALIGRDASLYPAWCHRMFVQEQLTSSHPACHWVGLPRGEAKVRASPGLLPRKVPAESHRLQKVPPGSL